ncbi:putative post-transcriptional gene silencing PAZ-Argonaute family [Rosa chinensis]|uniref:Putative post-transcriptional gene silencing PAZ-Argonaute family n=1 Tax=Rosa chinensis TaxID=74649 RepID=A0A2P6SJA6_ROSCH|nr:putative post-transcriptional gene silencing PAZ-Argonaute family [Rosa chinensis]
MFSHRASKKFETALFWRGYYQSLRPTQFGLSLNIVVSAKAFYQSTLVTEFIQQHFNYRDISKGLSNRDCLEMNQTQGIFMKKYPKKFNKFECWEKVKYHPYFVDPQSNPQPSASYSTATASENESPIELDDDIISETPSSSMPRPMGQKRAKEAKKKGKKAQDAAESMTLTIQAMAESTQASVELVKKRNEEVASHTKKVFEFEEAKEDARIMAMDIDTNSMTPQSKAWWKKKKGDIVAKTINCPWLMGAFALSELTFILEEDKQTKVSVIRYYHDKYCISLKHVALTALQCGNDSRPIYLPMELSVIICGQRYTGKLDKKQVTKLLRATCSRPTARGKEIKMVANDIHYHQNLMNSQFGIKVSKDMELVDARALPPPMVITARLCFSNSNNIDLSILTSDYANCHSLNTMTVVLKQRIYTPRMGAWNMDNKKMVNGGIVDFWAFVNFSGIPEESSDRFIKALIAMCNSKGMINVKVGGRNTVLNDAIQRSIPLVNDDPTIIIGADVAHPQPGEDSSPSIAAVVASMDWPEVYKYRGVLDGVSEGQFSQVLLYEMDVIRKACASLEEGYMPPVTFAVVQKRHHTRLFLAGNKSHRKCNVLPGTTVDTKICHPTEFDFYLTSHAAIQGTSCPTHYHVLFDENKFSVDALQILTNNLCYTYARCTRAVSVVPPVYYAHLAASRGRYYIKGDASNDASSGGTAAQFQILPDVHHHVKDVMFFC